MTKKHFNLFANALRAERPDKPALRAQWLTDVNVVAEICKASNLSFDKGKFLTACGV